LETCISVPFSEVMTASQNSFHINTLYPSIKGLWGISSIFMVQMDASF